VDLHTTWNNLGLMTSVWMRIAVGAGIVTMLHVPWVRAWAQADASADGAADTARSRGGPPTNAARLFADGEKAFGAGDYLLAARLFEQAYALAPHADASWNAAQSWYRAGEHVRAANLFDRYLREAKPNAKDRDQATALMVELARRLGKIQVFGRDLEELHVDDAAVARSTVYVAPGQHMIWGKQGNQIVRMVREVPAGETVSVVLEAPAPAISQDPGKARVSTDPSSAPAPAAGSAHARRPLDPAWFYSGLALTAVALGGTLVSGLDTRAAKSDFDATPTQGKLDEGRFRQDRTNLLSLVTLGLGVLTAASGIWLVEWRGQERGVAAGLTPGAAHVRVSF
jgi:tetratricopeptide (TPR) repeat protein